MHSMLLVVEKPPAGTSAEYAWRPFLDTAAQIVGTIPEVSTLGENFWLIPVQHALPTLLHEGAAVRSQIRQRVTRNYRALVEAAELTPAVRVLRTEGGWSAVLQVPAVQSEESLVLQLLEQDHVLVHPGYFFDFPREAFLIVSLLPRPDVFDRATARMLARIEAAQ